MVGSSTTDGVRDSNEYGRSWRWAATTGSTGVSCGPSSVTRPAASSPTTRQRRDTNAATLLWRAQWLGDTTARAKAFTRCVPRPGVNRQELGASFVRSRRFLPDNADTNLQRIDEQSQVFAKTARKPSLRCSGSTLAALGIRWLEDLRDIIEANMQITSRRSCLQRAKLAS